MFGFLTSTAILTLYCFVCGFVVGWTAATVIRIIRMKRNKGSKPTVDADLVGPEYFPIDEAVAHRRRIDAARRRIAESRSGKNSKKG